MMEFYTEMNKSMKLEQFWFLFGKMVNTKLFHTSSVLVYFDITGKRYLRVRIKNWARTFQQYVVFCLYSVAKATNAAKPLIVQ